MADADAEAERAERSGTIVVSVSGQTITLTGAVPAGTTQRLSNRLLYLDCPIR